MGEADRGVVADGAADVEGGDIACSVRAVGYGDDNNSSAGSARRKGSGALRPGCPVRTKEPILKIEIVSCDLAWSM